MPADPPQAAMDAFFLEQDEKLTEWWEAEMGEDIAHLFGVLILTNHRLIFVERQGVLSKRYTLTGGMPLENIPGMSIRKRLLGPPQLLVKGWHLVLGKPPFKEPALSNVQSRIANARERLLTRRAHPPASGP